MVIKIGPYAGAPAAYQEYDPFAPELAKKVAEALTAAEPAFTVEHIGSTAAGCGGKGIIDLMLLYPADFLEAAKRVLRSLGFQPQSTRDPFPEERPMRVGSIEYGGKRFRLHVHVLYAGAGEAQEARLFRDRLRSDPGCRAAYEAFKRGLLKKGVVDPTAYAEAKGEFIRAVLSAPD